MDFIIKRSFNNTENIEVCFCRRISDIEIQENILYIERLPHLDYLELQIDNTLQIAIGDVIHNPSQGDNIKTYKGLHYICAIINGLILNFESDEHSLLPLYYVIERDKCYVSSSFWELANILSIKTVNPNFFVDTTILYSNIGEDTYYKEIKRVKYGDVIVVDSSLKVKNIKRFYNYFIENPLPVKDSLAPMADLFIEISKYYLKDPCAVSLTGGFDTRLNTGCAHYYNTDFISCSYGKVGNSDVENSIFLSKELNLDYHLVELDRRYIQDNFFSTAIESMKVTGGLSGFNSPHTLFYAKTIGELRNVLVTGYLGSEIFANPKKGNDEVVSQTVIDYLKNNGNIDNYAYSVTSQLLDLEIINNNNEIEDSLNRLGEYFSNLPNNITKNQKISTFNFENIYRNTFGQWIYSCMHYLKIRDPFIDKEFFNAISKTHLSAFYREFIEKRLYKRIDGQRLYPQILQKVWPDLNRLTSSKGYSPYELLSFNGQIKLATKLLWTKKISKKQQHEMRTDNRSREAGVKHYIKDAENLFNEHYNSKLLHYLEDDSMINKMFALRSLNKKEFERML